MINIHYTLNVTRSTVHSVFQYKINIRYMLNVTLSTVHDIKTQTFLELHSNHHKPVVTIDHVKGYYSYPQIGYCCNRAFYKNLK